jgi:hypothetical protein
MGYRSFDLVDFKLAEADFFLEHFGEERGDFFAAQCYFSAFVAAARSVTSSLQAVLSDAPGFKLWYAVQQKRLRDDEIARFFHDARNLGQHVGASPVRGGSGGPGRPWLYHFAPCPDFPRVPASDVFSSGHHLMTLLTQIILDCYTEFGELIDPERYYSKEAYAKRGLTVEDAERELLGEEIAACIPSIRPEFRVADEDYRWQRLRDSMPGCRIDHLFEKYLRSSRPRPPRPAPLPAEALNVPEGWSTKGRWILPPGCDSVEDFLSSRNPELD